MPPCPQRTCTVCRTTKPVSEYYQNKRQRPDGTYYYAPDARCKPCMKASAKARHHASRYGLPDGWYQERYQQLNGCCEICGKPQPVLCVDHCHRTGSVRSLLCKHCNTGIGLLADNWEIVQRAAEYLRRFNK